MRVRILLADQSEADFYDMHQANEKPQFAGGLGDPLAHLHDRDLESDRPGRFLDHAPNPTGRRGATAHHSAGGERSTRKHEAVAFARRIATLLEEGRRAGEFERLVVLAPPAFLELPREALPQSLRSMVAAEIAKSFVHEPS
jgi:protein required for attachment to host cells